MTQIRTDIPSTPSHQSDPPGFDPTTFFAGVRAMLKACEGASKHDQAYNVIVACIDAGLNHGPRIIGTAKRLGFNPKHVGIILSDGLGPDPSRHKWYRAHGDVYQLHQ